MFSRIKILLAAFDRAEFSEFGLSARLEQYTYNNSRAHGRSGRTLVGPLAFALTEEP